MENRFLTLTLFPCCNLPLCSYSQTLRINLCPFFLQLHFKKVFPVFPLSYHRTLPRRLPTGISKLPSDCWFRISYDITKYQFDQIPKEYCVLSQNTKYHFFHGICCHHTVAMPTPFGFGQTHTWVMVSHLCWAQYEQQPLFYSLYRNAFDKIWEIHFVTYEKYPLTFPTHSHTHRSHVSLPLLGGQFERHPLFTVSHPATESAFSPHSPNLTHTTTPPPRPHAPAEPKAQHIHFASLNLPATIYLT